MDTIIHRNCCQKTCTFGDMINYPIIITNLMEHREYSESPVLSMMLIRYIDIFIWWTNYT